MPSLLSIGVSILGFLVLDGLWLGVVMKDFYVRQFASIGRIVDGSLAPIWPAAALVYVLLGLGVAALAVPRAESLAGAAAWGALLGLVVYGVYDLTNYATLAQWPVIVTIADIAWGTIACALVAMATFYVSAR
ncbi:MAG: DUF2177 family protein [Acidobacteria bacterium]|nr:DUF2177 family protein [Acidobacteriota bacterium]